MSLNAVQRAVVCVGRTGEVAVGIEDSFNFRPVSEQLTTSGAVTADQLRHLHEEGYGAVINLLPDSHESAVADEARIVQEQGMGYVHIPVDFGAPTHRDFQAFVVAMDDLADQKVHVHCAANWRVTAFYGLYAERTGRWSEAEADAFMHELWDPADHDPWARFIESERAARR